MKTTFDSIQTRESQYVLHTYRRQPVAFVRGKGPRLYDVDGREYLDFVSGIGVASLGHALPAGPSWRRGHLRRHRLIGVSRLRSS